MIKYIKALAAKVTNFVTNLLENIMSAVSEESKINIEFAMDPVTKIPSGKLSVSQRSLTAITGILALAGAGCLALKKGFSKEVYALAGVGTTLLATSAVNVTLDGVRLAKFTETQAGRDHEYRMAQGASA